MDPGRKASWVFGSGDTERIVAVDWAAEDEGDVVVLFRRDGDRIREERRPFEPFLWVAESALLRKAPEPISCQPCAGNGTLRFLARYRTWSELQRVTRRLRRETGFSLSSRDAPYFFLSDPVQQFLTGSGETFFKNLPFSEVRRMQLDIETRTGEGYDFPNAERESDQILAIGLSDSTGWAEIISLQDGDEKHALERFVCALRERDPDVIEGHNLFSFDLPYLIARAKRFGVPLSLGRDGSVPRVRSGRFSAGERTRSYPKITIAGRSVVDTYFLAQAYDVSHRSLPGLGLKEVARHFDLAGKDRTYIEGSQITRVYRSDPERVLRYLRDDLAETRGLADLFLPVYVAQAHLLPFAFQDVCVRGSAAKIEALMLRACVSEKHALPRPGAPKPFAGGTTAVFRTGVVHHVHHCDIRSLYPSIMLARRVGPSADERGIFLSLLEQLRAFRLEAKRRMQTAADAGTRREAEAMQTTFKVLINSFYGYLGFEQARFCDFDAAESVTAAGREILQGMIEWIRAHGGDPIEIDTDGIYFVPPAEDPEALDRFRRGLADALPEGIDVEFDGVYEAMFSYKMKNYALKTLAGEVLITGAALKSRGLEPFQRDFLRDWIGALLSGSPADRTAIFERYRRALLERAWDIRKLAKSERLSEPPEVYREKRAAGKTPRSAAMELALKSDREYRAGDTVSYYVAGERKNVAVYAQARLVSAWVPEARDENVAYYVAKLERLAKKFESFVQSASTEEAQGTLGLEKERP